MSYAVNQNSTSFRAINDAKDLLPGETFSASMPVIAVPVVPDGAGFITDLKALFGGVANIIGMGSYPVLLYSAVQSSDWVGVEACIKSALAANVISAAQYQSIKNLAGARNINVSL